jgi:hypothetical protein
MSAFGFPPDKVAWLHTMQDDVIPIVYIFPANPPFMSAPERGDVSKRLEIHVNLPGPGAEGISELFVKEFKAFLSECGVEETVGYLKARNVATRSRL